MNLRRPALIIACLVAAPLLSGGVPARAAEGGPGANSATVQNRRALSLEHQRKLDREANARQRQDRSNAYLFMDPKGGPTLSNLPDKYEHRPGYKQMEMKRIEVAYQPVKVDPRYVRRSSPTQYTSKEYGDLISQSAARYGIDEDLIYSVIRMESNFSPTAVSRAGACGLMQLMPGTAAEMGVTDIFDAAQNIDGGSQYLSKMLGIFGNAELALAAYNAGPERVREHKGIPPFQETRDYVRKVMNYWLTLKGGGATRESLLAEAERRIRTAKAPRKIAPVVTAKQYTVHFNSGLTQPADSVVDKDPYYVIVYNKREYFVRKDLVSRIAEPA